MVNKKSLATFVRTLGNQAIAGFKHFLNNVKIGGDLIHDPDLLGSSATNVLTVDAEGVVRKATSFTGGLSGGTVTSVALTAPSAFTVSGSPITTSGTIAIGGAGTAAQYVRGDGQLGDFPTTSGGGSSVSYYLNGSVNQGTLGGNVYREFSKIPILGAGTDFSIAADGYIAQFITDANDPSLLEIPGGNWNLEFYFSSSSSGGTPSFYVELSKYDGTTFTPIASNSSFPEFIAFGTIVSPYFSTLAVPQTTLAVTDRLAIRVYVIHSGRTITLHTEDNHLCQVITTFSTGLNALNGLTKQVQYFATGTSGTDFNISSVGDTHTFNIPTASGSNRGLLSTSDWINFTAAYNDKINSAAVTGTTTKTLTLTQRDGDTITASWTDINTDAVTSVFGRTGAVIAVSGDYNTSQVTENTNLYFTNARARTAISLTTSGTNGSATYNNTTGVLNVPQYADQFTGTVTSVNLISGPRINVDGGPITTNGSITVTHGLADGADFVTAEEFRDRVLSDGGTFEALGEVAIAIGSLSDTVSPVSTDYSDGYVLQNIAIDEFGHVLGVGVNDFDDRYVKNLTAGSGITVSGSPSSTAGLITVVNSDKGSSQNIFKNIAVAGQSTVVADNNNDTLTFIAGTNVTLTTNDTTDSVTINASVPASATPGDSEYARDYITPFTISSTWSMVNLNSTNIRVTANKSFSSDNRGYFLITFEVENTQSSAQFRMFKYKLYNSDTSSDVTDSESYWSGYMNGSSEFPYTTFSFHIPSNDESVSNGDIIELQVQELSSGTAPDIVYAALSYIDVAG